MESGKSNVKKVLSIIGNVLVWIFVAFAVVVTVLAFAAQANVDGVPSIGGKTILTIQSPSMEPTFKVGDIVIGTKLTPEEMRALKVGDIITYAAGDLDGDGVRDLNTHRIIEIYTAENGEPSYRTKGDGNQIADLGMVSWQYVICKCTEKARIPALGSVLNFLQQPTGFLVVVVLPLVLFFVYELVVFFRKLYEVKNSGKKQISAADEELIRQRAVEEYIRQQQAQKDAEAAETAEAAEAEETPTEEPIEEAPAEEAPVEEAPVEEAPVEETPAEEAPVEEAPAEEIPEETPAEEVPEEEPKKDAE